MSISQRLAAHRLALVSAAPAATPLPGLASETDETETKTTESNPEKDTDMTEEDKTALKAEGRKEGFEAANARLNAVLGSQHFAGRETLAKTLLATDLSAEQIDTALAAAAPAVTVSTEAVGQTTDSAARAEMAAAIAANKNSAIEAGETIADEKINARSAADSTWNKAYGLKEGVN